MVSMHYIIVFCTTQLNYVIAKKNYSGSILHFSAFTKNILCVRKWNKTFYFLKLISNLFFTKM